MRILGIDPGLASTGVGVIERHGETWRYLESNEVRTSSSSPLPKRLRRIHDLVDDCIRSFSPDAVAVETVFTAKNIKSAILMAHGRGAAILTASTSGVPVFEYSPLEIKSSVAGRGRATKAQVMHMVKVLLNLDKLPASDHQADALACALAHAFRSQITEAVADASSEEPESEAKFLLSQSRRSRRRGGFRRMG